MTEYQKDISDNPADYVEKTNIPQPPPFAGNIDFSPLLGLTQEAQQSFKIGDNSERTADPRADEDKSVEQTIPSILLPIDEVKVLTIEKVELVI